MWLHYNTAYKGATYHVDSLKAVWFEAAHATLAGAARGARSDWAKVKFPAKKLNGDATCVQHGDTWGGGRGKRIKG